MVSDSDFRLSIPSGGDALRVSGSGMEGTSLVCGSPGEIVSVSDPLVPSGYIRVLSASVPPVPVRRVRGLNRGIYRVSVPVSPVSIRLVAAGHISFPRVGQISTVPVAASYNRAFFDYLPSGGMFVWLGCFRAKNGGLWGKGCLGGGSGVISGRSLCVSGARFLRALVPFASIRFVSLLPVSFTCNAVLRFFHSSTRLTRVNEKSYRSVSGR